LDSIHLNLTITLAGKDNFDNHAKRGKVQLSWTRKILRRKIEI